MVIEEAGARRLLRWWGDVGAERGDFTLGPDIYVLGLAPRARPTGHDPHAVLHFPSEQTLPAPVSQTSTSSVVSFPSSAHLWTSLPTHTFPPGMHWAQPKPVAQTIGHSIGMPGVPSVLHGVKVVPKQLLQSRPPPPPPVPELALLEPPVPPASTFGGPDAEHEKARTKSGGRKARR